MIRTINFSQFCDSFSDTYKNNFSYEGKRALFDYLEQLKDDTDKPMELVTAVLCREFSEYDSLEDVQIDYENIVDIDDLQCQTIVIECSNGHLIIQQF